MCLSDDVKVIKAYCEICFDSYKMTPLNADLQFLKDKSKIRCTGCLGRSIES